MSIIKIIYVINKLVILSIRTANNLFSLDTKLNLIPHKVTRHILYNLHVIVNKL